MFKKTKPVIEPKEAEEKGFVPGSLFWDIEEIENGYLLTVEFAQYTSLFSARYFSNNVFTVSEAPNKKTIKKVMSSKADALLEVVELLKNNIYRAYL